MATTHRDVCALHHLDDAGHAEQRRAAAARRAPRPLPVVSEVELVVNDVDGRHPRIYSQY